VSDVGIDAHLEIVVEGVATGRLLALQIKSGESYFREAVPEGFVYRGDEAHLNYWINHSLPVVLVICKPGSQDAYWQVVSDQTVVKTDHGWKMIIPRDQPLPSRRGRAASGNCCRLYAVPRSATASPDV